MFNVREGYASSIVPGVVVLLMQQTFLLGIGLLFGSWIGAMVRARLEEKRLLERRVLPHNRRQRALSITAEGLALLEALVPGAQRLRERLLAPLIGEEQRVFMELLAKLVHENDDQNRAPLAVPDIPTK